MIVRIELKNLRYKGEHYFFNDILFTGEAYDYRDNQVYQIHEINEGVIVASHDYGLLGRAGMPKLDYYCIDVDKDVESAFLTGHIQNKPYTGVCYIFKSGFLASEILFIDGILRESFDVMFDGTGRFSSYYKGKLDQTETTEDREINIRWRDNYLFSIDSYCLDFSKRGKTCRLELTFNERRQIDDICMKGDYTYLNLLVPRDELGLDFTAFDELLMKKDIMAENLRFWSVDDKTFNEWFDGGLLNQVKNLTLFEMELSLKTITKLAALPNLQSLVWNLLSLPIEGNRLYDQMTQQYTVLAHALFALKESKGIKVEFVCDNIDLFPKYLFNNATQ